MLVTFSCFFFLLSSSVYIYVFKPMTIYYGGLCGNQKFISILFSKFPWAKKSFDEFRVSEFDFSLAIDGKTPINERKGIIFEWKMSTFVYRFGEIG